MGTWAVPLFIISLAIIALVVKKTVDLYFRKGLSNAQLFKGLHAIIFWGVISAVTGILGQATGIYNAMLAISRAESLSPAIIASGFGQALTTTIYGIHVLIVSGIVWFILLARYNRIKGALK